MIDSNEYIYGNYLRSFLKWAGKQDVYLIREFEHLVFDVLFRKEIAKDRVTPGVLDKLIHKHIKETFDSDSWETNVQNEKIKELTKELEIAKEILKFYADWGSYMLASLKWCPHCNKKESDELPLVLKQ